MFGALSLHALKPCCFGGLMTCWLGVLVASLLGGLGGFVAVSAGSVTILARVRRIPRARMCEFQDIV